MKVTDAAAVPPNVTESLALKFDIVRVIAVPPNGVPLVGDNEVRLGPVL